MLGREPVVEHVLAVVVAELVAEVARLAGNENIRIDLGPEAGDGGGTIVYAGTPSGLKKSKESRTAVFL
jgi:excinuclease UvrABC ATPase subunit